MIRAVCLVLALAAPQVAQADAGGDFIARLSGTWSGTGTIRTGAGAAPGATACNLDARPRGNSLEITGRCDGAAQGANLAVLLTWTPATQEFSGTFSGAAESGPANLTGRLSGSTLTLNVTSSSGGRSVMTLGVTGRNAARMAVTGRDGGATVQYVALTLRRA